jgi:transposase-like protein
MIETKEPADTHFQRTWGFRFTAVLSPRLVHVILRAYRYSLSLRDVEELFAERGLDADRSGAVCRHLKIAGRVACIFLLSALRDAAAAERLFRKALSDPSHPQPRVINTDKASLYGSAIAGLKAEGTLRRRCRHRPVQNLNNILE